MSVCKKALLFPTILASFLFLGVPAGGQDPAPEKGPDVPQYASNRIVVKFKKGVSPRAQQTHHIARGVTKSQKLSAGAGKGNARGHERDIDRIDIVTVPDGEEIEAMVRTYRADPDVEYAEPDYLTSVGCFLATTTPNDPRFAEQWALAKIQAPQAWDYTTGSSAVSVAVIDTGVDYNHQDLAANLWTNPGEIAGNGIDDDGNGYVDDVRGWDWVNNDNDPMDDNGHGTRMAGIISAVGNNGIGMAGVTWNCRIMALKTSNASGNGSLINHAAAIVYAANMGARIGNNSYNAPGTSQAMTDAIQYADSVGHITVTIAGNQGAEVSSYYPSNIPEAVTVAGTGATDVKMYQSNYGTLVDVSAPSINVLSSSVNNTYYLETGTSEAAPHAAAVLALLASQNSNRTNGQLIELLKQSCDDVDSLNAGFEGKLGNGRVNAFNAVSGLLKPKIELVGYTVDDTSGNGNGFPDRGETVALTMTLRNRGANATDLSGTLSTTDAYVSINGSTANFGPIANSQTGSNGSSPIILTVASDAPVDHTATMTLNLTGNMGSYAGTLRVSVNIGPNIAYVFRTFDDAGSGGSVPGAAEPGETVNAIVTLKNTWGSATNVTGTLTSTSPYVTILDGSGGWGTIGNSAEVANTATPFRLTLAPGTPMGSVIPFTIAVGADWNYAKIVTFNYLVGWSTDKTANVPVCTALENQSGPVSVTDGAGGVIVVWSDFRGGSAGIYAQRIDADGYVRWTKDGVPVCAAVGYQASSVRMAADGSGGAVIVWCDDRNQSSSSDIYAQRIDGNGNILWQVDGVAVCTASNSQWGAALATDGFGGAIVAWSDFRGGSVNEVYLQRVGADGSLQWADGGIPVAVGADIKIIGDGSGSAILCWTNGNSLYAQKVNSAGTPQWAAGGILPGMAPSGYILATNMTSDNAGGAVVAWSLKNNLYNGTESAYVQKIDASGALQWVSGGVSVVSQVTFSTSSPQLAADGAGGVIVVWGRYASNNNDIYAQKISSAGVIQWASGGAVVSNASYSQTAPSIVGDGSGGAIIAWHDSRNGPGYLTDIFAMKITAAGTAGPGWTANGIPVSTGYYYRLWPIIVGDGTGGAVIAWTDYRNTSYGTIANSDIYAQRISSVGIVGKQSPKLTGISTRGYVGTGTSRLVGGIMIDGSEPKTVIIRAKGPSLADSGLTGVLADPYLKLYSGSTVVAQNDNWQTNDPLQLSPIVWKGTAADIQAAGVAPSGTNSVKEAAIMVTLPPGAYTCIVSGVNNGVGIGLVEVYELTTYPSSSQLTGISTRGYVGTGTSRLVGGIIISGTDPRKVIIRAKGPSLVDFGLTGVLADPYLKLYSGSTVVAQNDNWQTNDPLQLSPIIWKGTAADIQAAGVAPSGTNSVKEAAIMVTLPPGAYTCIVSGVNNGVGIGLVEVYEVLE